MTGRRRFSPQALAVLAALSGAPAAWHHGYGIARETGLRSGTLYPILIRLADRGLVAARWEDGQPAGRPRRHQYQLTAAGLAAARAALAGVPASASAVRRRPGPLGRPGLREPS
jgi:PadR family transcriptional regulator, regulatory protein PadR